MRSAARLLVFTLGCFVLAWQAAADPVRGIDYRELGSPRPSAAATIEVIEFFWYRCPHCYEFEPSLTRWAAKLPADVVVKRVPVVFNAEWAIDARLFYALEAMGEEARLHAGLYDAIHLEGGRRLDRSRYETWVENWLSRQGVDLERFRATAASQPVRERVDEARRMTAAYGVEGTPTLAIDGRYVVDAGAGSQPRMLGVSDFLLAQARRQRTLAQQH